ncbi:Inner membrane protein YhcB [Candidatus Providencia siddallii]|uniref:Z-ring associated protein G n=1 Tax=Candidatus Providencia siddallii TaxID=1715285 RepID=A0A0M6W9R8_9GAMM|nr:Inner membrane protein YhcB [Candidatus Providencia siddallii]
MIWLYILLCFIIGFIIGVLVSHYNPKLYKQKTIKVELEKKNIELEDYHKKIIKHFFYTAKLIEELEDNYYKLYQHMIYSSSELLQNLNIKDNPFNKILKKPKSKNEEFFIKKQPKDYSNT